MNGWECFFRIVSHLITSGYGLYLIVGAVICFCAWSLFGGMTSEDKLEGLKHIMGWPAVAASGWIVALLVIAGAKYLLDVRQKDHMQQLDHFRSLRERVRQVSPDLLTLDSDE